MVESGKMIKGSSKKEPFDKSLLSKAEGDERMLFEVPVRGGGSLWVSHDLIRG